MREETRDLDVAQINAPGDAGITRGHGCLCAYICGGNGGWNCNVCMRAETPGPRKYAHEEQFSSSWRSFIAQCRRLEPKKFLCLSLSLSYSSSWRWNSAPVTKTSRSARMFYRWCEIFHSARYMTRGECMPVCSYKMHLASREFDFGRVECGRWMYAN